MVRAGVIRRPGSKVPGLPGVAMTEALEITCGHTHTGSELPGLQGVREHDSGDARFAFRDISSLR